MKLCGRKIPLIYLNSGAFIPGGLAALALGINPLLDMFETACNVAGDNVGNYVIGSKMKLRDK